MPADESLWQVSLGDGPILATAIHNGHEIREELAGIMAISEADRLREEDPHTARWTVVAPHRIVPRRSRFEVDLNRPRARAVYRRPADAWGLGIWERPPTEAEVGGSLEQYDAFYELLGTVLDDLARTHGRFVVLDVHSYNHRRRGPSEPPDDPEANPVVNVGTGSMDRNRWAGLVDRFTAELSAHEVRGERLDVRENVRFRGGHLAEWVHRRFPSQGCVLALEFKKVFMDEWTGVVDDVHVEALVEALAGTVPGLLASLRQP